MTIPTGSRTRDLAYGLAQLLADDGVGFTFRDDTAPYSATEQYAPTELGFFIGSLPEKPAQCVAIVPYPLTLHPTFTSDVEGVQFLTRGGASRSRTWAIRDVIRRQLRGRFPIRLTTGLHIASLSYGSGTTLGRDADNRWTESDNFITRLGANNHT